MRVAVLLCAAFLPVVARAEEKVDVAQAEELARTLGRAFLAGEFDKIADLTCPQIIEAMGGKDKMVEIVEKGMKQVKEQGYSFKKYTVGKAEAPVIDGKTTYVVIPTNLEMKTPSATVVTNSYLLGVSEDKGKTWTFADGAGLSDPAKRKVFFPKLPEELKLPEKKAPKVTED